MGRPTVVLLLMGLAMNLGGGLGGRISAGTRFAVPLCVAPMMFDGREGTAALVGWSQRPGGQEWEPLLYLQRADGSSREVWLKDIGVRPLGLGGWVDVSVSPDGREALVRWMKEGAPHGYVVSRLAVNGGDPRVILEVAGQAPNLIYADPWSSDGKRWVSRAMRRCDRKVELHNGDRVVPITYPPLGRDDRDMHLYWVSDTPDTAYVRVDDGQVYRLTPGEAKAVCRVPEQFCPKGDVLFVLREGRDDAELRVTRVDLESGAATEKTIRESKVREELWVAGLCALDGDRFMMASFPRVWVVDYALGTVSEVFTIPTAEARDANAEHFEAKGAGDRIWVKWVTCDGEGPEKARSILVPVEVPRRLVLPAAASCEPAA